MLKRIRFWVLDKIGTRAEHHINRGYGDFDIERGWWFFGHWFSYDGNPKD